ncbi:MAG: class I SAM-dependent methyltransferase [Rhodoferax sp.]|nr:class I SAM-dependent methyltransferase [Rhodoferax sp.]
MLLSGSHQTGDASEWVVRWSHLVQSGASVLDIACGSGRHMAWFASRGCQVIGIDRAQDALDCASGFGTTVLADIENDPWPLIIDGLPRQFDLVVVTNYLWRPIFQHMLDSLAPGGLLLYETFTQGNETVGKPSRPDFLLKPGELLQLCLGLHIVAYENGFLSQPDRFVQRIAAFRASGDADASVGNARRLLSLK